MDNIKTEITIDEDLCPLVPGFYRARVADLKSVAEFLELKDFDSIARISHTIKGIARPYGFPTLERLCRDLEVAAKSKDVDRSQQLIKQADDYMHSYEQ